MYWQNFNFCRDGASTSQRGKLLFDYCTQYLLALDLADNAFWGINSTEEFRQLQTPPDETKLLLGWTDAAKRPPILRHALYASKYHRRAIIEGEI